MSGNGGFSFGGFGGPFSSFGGSLECSSLGMSGNGGLSSNGFGG